jgi:hypothetical protein
MGLSNPDRASATSIYTHVARLFIPPFYSSLSPRIACPVSLSSQPRVLSAPHCMSCQLQPSAPVHVLSAAQPPCMSSQLSSQPVLSAPTEPRACPLALSFGLWPAVKRTLPTRGEKLSRAPVLRPLARPWTVSYLRVLVLVKGPRPVHFVRHGQDRHHHKKEPSK